MAEATLADNLRSALLAGQQQIHRSPQWVVLGLAGMLWLCGQWLGIWLLFLPCSLLLALLLLGFIWPRWQLRQVKIARHLPKFLRAQECGYIEYQVSSRWPLWQLTIEQALPCGNLLDTRLCVAFLHGHQTLGFAVAADDCGLFALPAVTISCGFPFGLWPATRIIPVAADELWVHPHVVTWQHSPMLPGTHAGAYAAKHSTATCGASHFIELREYQAGDSPHLIDWKTSAKYQQWRVKCFASDEQPRVLMALDTRAEFTVGLQGRSTRAKQASLAASLSRHFCGIGREVWLVTEFGCLKLPAGNGHFAPLDDFLITLPATGTRSAAELLAEYLPHSRAQLLVLWRLDTSLTEQHLQVPAGANLWQLIMDQQSFAQPLRFAKATSKRRDHQTWDFHLSANTQLELLFREVSLEGV